MTWPPVIHQDVEDEVTRIATLVEGGGGVGGTGLDDDGTPFFAGPYQPPFPHLNVRTYGAKGDGATDDQTDLQTAFTAGNTLNLPVYVPPGTYLHSDRLNNNSAVVFGSPGGRSSILKGTTNIDHAVNMLGTGPELHNLTIMADGKSPRSSDRGGNGIYVDTATDYRIINCNTLHIPGSGIMAEYSSGGKVRYCQVELTGADGIYHTEGCFDAEISYNKLIACGDDAIAVTSWTALQTCHDIEAHHNTLLGAFESRGMSMNGGYNLDYHDNHIDGGTAGVSITDHYGVVQTTASTITGNTIRNINKYIANETVVGGGALHLWNSLTGHMTGISITANRIFRSFQNDIYVGSTGRITATIGSNTFYSDVTFLDNANTHGSTVITQSPANTDSTVASYPGDLVAASIGGMLATYEYDPAVVF